jgi:hypothetical protein
MFSAACGRAALEADVECYGLPAMPEFMGQGVLAAATVNIATVATPRFVWMSIASTIDGVNFHPIYSRGYTFVSFLICLMHMVSSR